MRNDDGCGLIVVLFLLGSLVLAGCSRVDALEKRLNWLEADHNNLKWDFDKLKREQGK